jgi:two-component system cell cycle response regulator CpdR
MFGREMSRVLIVEDDETVRGFLCRALERGGYQPIAVRTGEEALATVRAPEGVDVALIDGILPDMHGVRLAEELLNDAAAAQLPLCFVTGALRGHVPAVAGLGALGKPFRIHELHASVAALLDWRAGGGSPIEERWASLRRLEQGFLVGP